MVLYPCIPASVDGLDVSFTYARLNNTMQVELKHVNKSFRHNGSALEVLQDVNLTVGEGEFVCLLGEPAQWIIVAIESCISKGNV